MRNLYFIIGLILLGAFLGAYLERSKSQINYHETIYQNGEARYEYRFSNFMGKPHKYGVYIRDLRERNHSFSFVVGRDDRILFIPLFSDE